MYGVDVTQENGWYIGRVVDRPGVTTQGRTLDELVVMLRDAIEAAWDEREVELDLRLKGSLPVITPNPPETDAA